MQILKSKALAKFLLNINPAFGFTDKPNSRAHAVINSAKLRVNLRDESGVNLLLCVDTNLFKNDLVALTLVPTPVIPELTVLFVISKYFIVSSPYRKIGGRIFFILMRVQFNLIKLT